MKRVGVPNASSPPNPCRPAARHSDPSQRAMTRTGAANGREAMHPAGTIHPLHAVTADRADECAKAHGCVVTYSPTHPDRARSHEGATRTAISKALAALLDYEFGGEYNPSSRYPVRLYFVPDETLVGIKAASALGIRT